jgi:hypothetical protein
VRSSQDPGAPDGSPPQGSELGRQPVNVPRWLFGLELLYLLVLFVSAGLFAKWGAFPHLLPDPLGPLPLAIPWFGSLGAVIIGLTGIFQHQKNWNHSYDYWHIARPFTGIAFGVVGVLIFMTIVAAASSTTLPPAGSGKLVYYVVAFLIGYREETFRQLIKRVTDLVLSPISPDSASSNSATDATGTSPPK